MAQLCSCVYPVEFYEDLERDQLVCAACNEVIVNKEDLREWRRWEPGKLNRSAGTLNYTVKIDMTQMTKAIEQMKKAFEASSISAAEALKGLYSSDFGRPVRRRP